MHLPSSTDVLIVGAGPSGLALALQLARAGVPHVIIDRQPAGENASRACVVHAGTLEALEPLGLVPELLARGIQVPIFRVRDRGRALLTIDFRNLPSRYPYTLMLPQSDTEAVLLVGLEAHGETVLRPCDLKAVRWETEGATVAVRGAEGERILQARYVIGCDGMHSVVREQAGHSLRGRKLPRSVRPGRRAHGVAVEPRGSYAVLLACRLDGRGADPGGTISCSRYGEKGPCRSHHRRRASSSRHPRARD